MLGLALVKFGSAGLTGVPCLQCLLRAMYSGD